MAETHVLGCCEPGQLDGQDSDDGFFYLPTTCTKARHVRQYATAFSPYVGNKESQRNRPHLDGPLTGVRLSKGCPQVGRGRCVIIRR